MCSKMRSFVNLLANDLKAGGGYTLRKIDMGPFFASNVVRSSDSRRRLARLPRPLACFESPTKAGGMEFFLLGSKVVGISWEDRRTILCDTVTSTVRIGPDLLHSKSADPAWAVVGGGSRLFVINMFPEAYGTPCFEALRFDDDEIQDWVWDLLPSPSLLDIDPFESDSDIPYDTDCDIKSYGAGDEENIWVSTEGKGTYTFNVTAGAWCKAGDWALPFVGRVHYIPDYNLCLGFCNKTLDLCSTELLTVGVGVAEDQAALDEPPVLRKVWNGDIDEYIAAGWYLARSHLTYLGCGKFCVTRFFDTTHDWGKPMYHVAVMTAIEAIASGSGELQMVNRDSRRYKFSLGTMFGWAL